MHEVKTRLNAGIVYKGDELEILLPRGKFYTKIDSDKPFVFDLPCDVIKVWVKKLVVDFSKGEENA